MQDVVVFAAAMKSDTTSMRQFACRFAQKEAVGRRRWGYPSAARIGHDRPIVHVGIETEKG
jgi:hypothetical protein